MKPVELQNKLTAAARLQPPDERVPYAFEKRIMAVIAARSAIDRLTVWSQGLWRAAISCVVLVLLLGALSWLQPAPAANDNNNPDLSQAFENTLLASADQSDLASMPVNNWKVIFSTVVIFGAGVITGGLLVNYAELSSRKVSHPKPAATTAARSANGEPTIKTPDVAKLRAPELISKQFMQQLDECLQLKPEQRSVVQKIISEGQNQIRKAMLDTRLEIREILTPEQRAHFDEIIKRPIRKNTTNTNTPAVTNAVESSAKAP